MIFSGFNLKLPRGRFSPGNQEFFSSTYIILQMAKKMCYNNFWGLGAKSLTNEGHGAF